MHNEIETPDECGDKAANGYSNFLDQRSIFFSVIDSVHQADKLNADSTVTSLSRTVPQQTSLVFHVPSTSFHSSLPPSIPLNRQQRLINRQKQPAPSINLTLPDYLHPSGPLRPQNPHMQVLRLPLKHRLAEPYPTFLGPHETATSSYGIPTGAFGRVFCKARPGLPHEVRKGILLYCDVVGRVGGEDEGELGAVIDA